MLEDKFSVALVVEVIENIRTIYQERSETIPSYSSHEINEVVYCCNRTYTMVGGQELYPSRADKIAALIYNLDKGHYLSNGNKRICFGMVILFLSLEQCIQEYIHNSDKLNYISLCIDRVSKNEWTKKELILGIQSIV